MAGLKRNLQIEQRACIIKAFHIDETAGTPVLAVGSTDGSIVDNGVGDYTITFSEPFTRVIGAQVTPAESGRIANIAALSGSSVQIEVFQADGATAEDADCYVWVMGAMASDET
jgi:hypothetical protein